MNCTISQKRNTEIEKKRIHKMRERNCNFRGMKKGGSQKKRGKGGNSDRRGGQSWRYTRFVPRAGFVGRTKKGEKRGYV